MIDTTQTAAPDARASYLRSLSADLKRDGVSSSAPCSPTREERVIRIGRWRGTLVTDAPLDVLNDHASHLREILLGGTRPQHEAQNARLLAEIHREIARRAVGPAGAP
jgi:hypothetical protein